jgi:hypothetical protein
LRQFAFLLPCLIAEPYIPKGASLICHNKYTYPVYKVKFFIAELGLFYPAHKFHQPAWQLGAHGGYGFPFLC